MKLKTKWAKRFIIIITNNNVLVAKKQITIEDVLKDDDLLLLHSTNDASIWAKAFIHTLKKNKWNINDIDVDLMLGWFANAMMAQEDREQ